MNQQEAIITEIMKIDASVFSDDQYFNPDGYLNKIYRFLNKIKPGKVYTVSNLANAETKQLFTEIVKLYICEVKHTTIIFIRDDYKQFRKNPTQEGK